MANNQQLPRPNLPKNGDAPASGPTPSQPAVDEQKQDPPKSSQTKTPQSGSQQSAGSGSGGAIKPPPQQAKPQSKPQTAGSVPAGLDPNAPGGSAPNVDETGRALGKAAQISATRQRKDFGQSTGVGLDQFQSDEPAKEKQPQQGPTVTAAAGEPKTNSPGQQPPVGQAKSLETSGAKQQPSLSQISKAPSAPSAPPTSPQAPPSAPASTRPQVQGKQEQSKKQQPTFAKKKKPLTKFLPYVLGGLALLGLIFLGITLLGGREAQNTAEESSKSDGLGPVSSSTSGKQVTLTYWGLWEPNSVLEEVFQDFEEQNPNITVNYEQKSHKDYRTRLQTEIASGSGPDLFRFHATWVPMMREELASLPSSVISSSEYDQMFYSIMKEQLTFNGKLVGIPLMYEGLGLYYNEDILETANREVPSTWSELKLLAAALTEYDQDTNDMLRGGLAIGNTDNVEHWSDILGLLIYQNGGDPAETTSNEVGDAMKFYASFNTADDGRPVFDTTLPNSSVAFAREELAMMFAPSWRAHEVLNMNPDLNFGIAPVPKLSDKELGWASYWAEGVSSKSSNQQEAWQLLKYMSSKSVMKKLYSQQSQIRAFGEIYPRKDLAEEVESDLVTAYLLDAPNAVSWYLCSATHDNGINDNIIEYYQDALNEYQDGSADDDVLQTLDQGVSQILRQHSVEVE